MKVEQIYTDCLSEATYFIKSNKIGIKTALFDLADSSAKEKIMTYAQREPVTTRWLGVWSMRHIIRCPQLRCPAGGMASQVK